MYAVQYPPLSLDLISSPVFVVDGLSNHSMMMVHLPLPPCCTTQRSESSQLVPNGFLLFTWDDDDNACCCGVL